MNEKNILDIVEEPGPDLKPGNLIRYIWIYPTSVYQFVLKHLPGRYVSLLFILQGIVTSLNRASNKNMGDDYALLLLVGGAIFFGALGGYVFNYFLSYMLMYSGNLLKGHANFKTITIVLAWSYIPVLFNLVLIVIKYLFFGKDMFSSDLEIEKLSLSAGMVVFGLLEITLYIWSIFILVRGIMLVQSFSGLKAIANVLLPAVIIVLVASLAALAYFTFYFVE